MSPRRAAASVLLGISLAGLASSETVRIGANQFCTGVPTESFNAQVAPQSRWQRASSWCWAACIQMIFDLQGAQIDQGDIVQWIYGHQVNATAYPQQVLAVLNGVFTDRAGQRWQVSAQPGVTSASELIADLDAHRPLFAGLSMGTAMEHACLVTAATYHLDAGGMPVIDAVVLRNPWPNSMTGDGREELSWAEFAWRCTFIARVQIAPARP